MCYVQHMPQLHLYVSDATADVLREDAQEANLSLSRYMAKVLTDATHRGWPKGYLDGIFGTCPDFSIPEEPPYEPIEPLDMPGAPGA